MSHQYQGKQSKKFRGKYVNHFVTSKCAPDMLIHELFPNVKEITESWGIFEGTLKLGEGFEWNNPNVTVVAVGDGHKPRTAATFAFRTNWLAISVDPMLVPRHYNVNRLTLLRQRIEEIKPINCDGPVLIVLPHSHARIIDCLDKIKGKQRAIISMDCCVRNIVPDKAPDVEYVDENIWSPKNLIRVWRNV